MTTLPTNFVIAGLHTLDEADRFAVLATMTRVFGGFARRDVDLLREVYTTDADWINAFGSVKHGSDEIIDYLRGLFEDGNFNQGRIVAGPECRLRRLSRDSVVVLAHLKVQGQGLVRGGSIALRDNRSVHVLVRQADGAWRVTTQMFMDAHQDQTFARHG